MDKQLFADLVESMQQHNEIIPGTRKAARATKVDAQSIEVLRAKGSWRSKRSSGASTSPNTNSEIYQGVNPTAPLCV